MKLLTDALELDIIQLCTKHNITSHQLYLVSLGRVLQINAAEEAAELDDEDEDDLDTDLRRYVGRMQDNMIEDPEGTAEGVLDDWTAAYEAITGEDFHQD